MSGFPVIHNQSRFDKLETSIEDKLLSHNHSVANSGDSDKSIEVRLLPPINKEVRFGRLVRSKDDSKLKLRFILEILGLFTIFYSITGYSFPLLRSPHPDHTFSNHWSRQFILINREFVLRESIDLSYAPRCRHRCQHLVRPPQGRIWSKW